MTWNARIVCSTNLAGFGNTFWSPEQHLTEEIPQPAYRLLPQRLLKAGERSRRYRTDQGCQRRSVLFAEVGAVPQTEMKIPFAMGIGEPFDIAVGKVKWRQRQRTGMAASSGLGTMPAVEALPGDQYPVRGWRGQPVAR